MKTILYRISTAALVLSFAGSSAWAQTTGGGNVGSMMGSTGTAGMMGNGAPPAGMTIKGSGTIPAPATAGSPRGSGPAAGNYGYGPWMMGGGGYSGYAPGPWMMGGGWVGPQMMGWGAYGPGARGGYGPGPWAMGPWMMGGWMGPQMMGWGGGYGACGGAFGPTQQANLDLTVTQVKANLERVLAIGGNVHIKLGAVVQKNPDTITADIVTTDNGGLVQRLEINRKTGFVQPVEQ